MFMFNIIFVFWSNLKGSKKLVIKVCLKISVRHDLETPYTQLWPLTAMNSIIIPIPKVIYINISS
jgi:hypothetical protein